MVRWLGQPPPLQTGSGSGCGVGACESCRNKQNIHMVYTKYIISTQCDTGGVKIFFRKIVLLKGGKTDFIFHIYMTIYKSTNLQSVNIKTLKSSNRSNKLMFAYLLNTD